MLVPLLRVGRARLPQKLPPWNTVGSRLCTVQPALARQLPRCYNTPHKRRNMERTLAIIKPDAVQRNLAGKILARLEAEGFVILGLKMVYLSKQDAESFYEVHRGRPFFASLTSYMASGPAIPILLQRDNAMQALRELMG